MFSDYACFDFKERLFVVDTQYRTLQKFICLSRFYLASDTTGELWLSSDESESNLVKIVTLNGWTDHNQWLKLVQLSCFHLRDTF